VTLEDQSVQLLLGARAAPKTYVARVEGDRGLCPVAWLQGGGNPWGFPAAKLDV